MATTGKNAPCYCGSRRPYKECCYAADIGAGHVLTAAKVLEDFGASTDEKEFSLTEADAMASLDFFGHRGNSTPVYEFCGLTPEEMHQFLYSPFASPDCVKFNLSLEVFPDSPFFRLFSFLLKGAATNLKATARGNLPRDFVRKAVLLFYDDPDYEEGRKRGALLSELDFVPLHIVRLVAELAGMITKEKNLIRTSGMGSEVAHKGMNGSVLLEVFKVYTIKFNWAYCDRYPEIPSIQTSFLFMLYALSKFGERFRPAAFYEDLFLSAFPLAVRNVAGSAYETPEQAVKRCFTLRMLSRFALFFGFIELKEPRTDRRGGLGELRKTPFLDEWILFEEK